MTQTSKIKKIAAPDAAQLAQDAEAGALKALQALLRTALPDLNLDVREAVNPAALSAALTRAHEAWGLGLRHVQHEVRAEEGGTLGLYADGARVGSVQDAPEVLASAYATMQALDADGLSSWPVLPEGHRFTLEAGTRQIRVLVEDGRDFESHWTAHTGGLHFRTGRRGDDLWVEAFRAAPGRDLVQDAAWEVVERIKDRALRRELQRRAEEKGILGAVLGARGEAVEASMRRSPGLHFTVSAAVMHSTTRTLEAWKALQKEAVAALEAAQKAQVDRLVDLLGRTGR